MIMGRKVEAKVKIELFTIIGRFLFAWFFIFSGFKSIKEIIMDDLVRKEFGSMMVGIMNLRKFTPEEVTSIEMTWVPFLVLLCAYAKVIGGFLILIDYYIAATIDLVLYLFITTSVRCVYYSKAREPEFNVFLQRFMQNMTFLGAILFYIEMKITIGRNQSKRKAPKIKKT